MNQRSLVGMTQSARKRAARRWLWPWMNRKEALQDFREMIAESPQTKVEYGLARRRYRIGERLRPCPNPFCSTEDGCALRQCHGSVLPAKRREEAK